MREDLVEIKFVAVFKEERGFYGWPFAPFLVKCSHYKNQTQKMLVNARILVAFSSPMDLIKSDA